MKGIVALIAAAGVALTAGAAGAQTGMLGPKDGAGLEAVDTGRVAIGSTAPDFTLAALGGKRITLSEFRGKKNIILVFYRGYW